MPEDEDWLWRPMLAGMCTYLELTRGPLTLVDVAVMNDILDVKQENEGRSRMAADERR